MADRAGAADRRLQEGRRLPEPGRRRSSSPDLLSVKVASFNDAPTGQIFADRAKAVTIAPYKGTHYFAINDAMQQALTRVEQGSSPQESWDKWVNDVKALG